MKTTLLALAAAVGLALATPSLALAHTGDQPASVQPKKVEKVVKGKKVKLAKLHCAKPVKIKGVMRCPVKKAALPK